MTVLSQASAAFFENRGISPELAARFEIYTAARDAKGAVVANPRGQVIAFPFVEHGVVVNEKYRGPEKQFWHRKGGRRTFWNADVLDDPALEAGLHPLIITEGIEDALSSIECGFPLTVSVPDGAPPATESLAPLDVEAERSGKFEFLWNNRDRLRRIKRFVLAVDKDAPGQRLAAEMVRRLGAARCQFVSYPADCKDLNDVLMRHGGEAVTALVRDAKQYPVRGLYRLSEYPDLVPMAAISLGWAIFDGLPGNGWMKMFAGEFMVVTGTPGHGKSTWVLNVLVNLARKYQWRAAIFSPEMPTVPYLRNKLRRIIAGSDRPDAAADRFIEANFTFIDNDPNDEAGEDITLDWLLEKARDAVLRDGIRVFFIDPWNEIEHARRRDEGQSEYIGRAIRQLKRFGRQYEVAIIVAAHPTKDVFDRGKLRTPTLYDIEGSAHWFNKCDHGVIIERHESSSQSTVYISKVRFDESGYRGAIKMKFDVVTQRYDHLDPDHPEFAFK